MEPGAKEKIECENSVNRIDIGLLFSHAGFPKPHQAHGESRALGQFGIYLVSLDMNP